MSYLKDQFIHLKMGVNNEDEIITQKFNSQNERILIEGQSGSGKTWCAFNLIGQTFFEHEYSWLFFDIMDSYKGIELPQVHKTDLLNRLHINPRGISNNQIHIFKPFDYISNTEQNIHEYRIPLWVLCQNIESEKTIF